MLQPLLERQYRRLGSRVMTGRPSIPLSIMASNHVALEQLKRSLHSEPWLFTVDRRGRVAARLEGSFGFTAFERAIRAALRER